MGPKLGPRQRPSHGTAMVVFTATVSQPMADTAMLDTARGLLTLRLTPGMDMEDSMVTDSQPMVVMDTDCGARRRGLPMLRPSLRPMPGSDMVDSTATVLVWAMAAMDMARGLPMLRPNLRLMPGLDMVDSMATVLVWAMAAMVMEVLATDTARGPLRLSPKP